MTVTKTFDSAADSQAGAMTFYIAGPMAGRPYFNFPAFDEARDDLQRKGFNVISPADLDREVGIDPFQFERSHRWDQAGLRGEALHQAIERDLDAIRRCDAIYMLDGWENSMGARAEKAVAEWMGLEVFFQSAVPGKREGRAKEQYDLAMRFQVAAALIGLVCLACNWVTAAAGVLTAGAVIAVGSSGK